MKIEKFWETKRRRKVLEWLKQKVGIFIGNNNIFNPILYE